LDYDSKTSFAPDKISRYNGKTAFAPDKISRYDGKTIFTPDKNKSNYLIKIMIYKHNKIT